MPRCKAPEILRPKELSFEAYLAEYAATSLPAGRQGKRRRWAFFSSLIESQKTEVTERR
jgi:hypothetical protein